MLFQNEAKSKMCHAYSLLTYSIALLDNKDYKKEHRVDKWDLGTRLATTRNSKKAVFDMTDQLTSRRLCEHPIRATVRKSGRPITRMSKLVCFLGNPSQQSSVFVEAARREFCVIYTRIACELLIVWLSLVQGKHMLWPFILDT